MINFRSFSEELENIMMGKTAGIGRMTGLAGALAKAPKSKIKFAPKKVKSLAGPGPTIPGFSARDTAGMAASNDFSRVGAMARPEHGRI